MRLRDYQAEAEAGIFREFEDHASTLTVLPTGLGKTVLFADVIRQMHERGCRAMVLAHREELITQAADKIRRVTGLEAQIEMGEYRVSSMFGEMPPVVVSTVQTHCAGGDGAGRMSKFDPQDFGLVVIDEAHHAAIGPSALRDIADRIEAALKRERAFHAMTEEANERLREHLAIALKGGVGNGAKSREALQHIAAIPMPPPDEMAQGIAVEMREVAIAALANPRLNCEVGTVQEQSERFRAYCDAHKDKYAECLCCPLVGETGGHCELAWAQMPYESEVAE